MKVSFMVVFVGFLGATTFLTGGLLCPALANTQRDAVIALHATAHSVPHRAEEIAALPCRDFVVEWPLETPADLYLVVANGYSEPGIAGVSCGIWYNMGDVGGHQTLNGQGVDVLSWTLCVPGTELRNGSTGLPEDDWPASGGGNRITWDHLTDCRDVVVGINGVQVVVGVFYVYAYSEDYFAMTGNSNLPTGPELLVIDCDGNESQLAGIPGEVLGACHFNDEFTLGENPCLHTPVRTSSWGRIKQKY